MTSTDTIAAWIGHDCNADPLALAVALADPSPEIDVWLATQEREGLFFLPAGFKPNGRVPVLGGSEAGEQIVQACRKHRGDALSALGGGLPTWCEGDPARMAELRERLR